MKCLCCRSTIVFWSCHSQPSGGTEFVGGSVYGSRVTDDQTLYAIYICDNCFEQFNSDETLVSNFREFRRTNITREPVKKVATKTKKEI